MLNLTEQQRELIILLKNKPSKIVNVLKPNIEELHNLLSYTDIVMLINKELDINISYPNFMRIMNIWRSEKTTPKVEKKPTPKEIKNKVSNTPKVNDSVTKKEGATVDNFDTYQRPKKPSKFDKFL